MKPAIGSGRVTSPAGSADSTAAKWSVSQPLGMTTTERASGAHRAANWSDTATTTSARRSWAASRLRSHVDDNPIRPPPVIQSSVPYMTCNPGQEPKTSSRDATTSARTFPPSRRTARAMARRVAQAAMIRRPGRLMPGTVSGVSRARLAPTIRSRGPLVDERSAGFFSGVRTEIAGST